MKTYLVTGAAGFIGANFIKYMLAEHQDIKIVVLDLLTYAGNLGTIAEDIDGERCEFVKGDICDRDLADAVWERKAISTKRLHWIREVLTVHPRPVPICL